MKFRELAGYLEKLEKTSSRNQMTEILAELFKKADAAEIDKIVYLVLGELAPSYQGIVLNIADKMMLRIIAQAFDEDINKVKSLYKKEGDLGNVASALAVSAGKDLSVAAVFEKLLEVAKEAGEGSQERKISLTAKLLGELDPASARFVARIPVGRLRLGFSDKTTLDGLSWMLTGDKSAKPQIEKSYQVLPDVGILAKKIKEEGLDKATRNISPQVGVPVAPMLAQRLKSPKEMVAKMGQVAVEPKLDGLRLSIHFKSGKDGFVKAYTRNMNETAWMFPELRDIGSQINGNEVILDSEAVGLDEKTKQMVDFQTTMTRRRKHEIEKVALKTGIEFFVFDLIYKDGKSFMDSPYTERRAALEKTVKEGKRLKLVEKELTQSSDRITALYQEKVKEGLEGIIVKKADSTYVPGRTGWRWVKMKQMEKAAGKLADTVDAVVMGYTAGKGKRVSFGVGQFLVGIIDGGLVKTTTKIGTGLTDEQFRELKKRLMRLEVKDKPQNYVVQKNYLPDFWVRPEVVVEIAADEITKSPSHTAGLALRFPRLVRFRDDKSPEQATTLEELTDLYKSIQ